MILRQIQKLAEQLDREGYIEQADQLDEILASAAEVTRLSKVAASLEVKIPIEEKPESNQWLATFNVFQNGQLRAGNLDSLSSPIYQSDDLKAAGNKQPGIQAMKAQLANHIKDFKARYPDLRTAKFTLENPLFV